jgi:hypothetical protein
MVEPNQRPGKLHTAARMALREAQDHLGDDAERFRAAIDRYVNAVEVADAARRRWEGGSADVVGGVDWAGG